ncbi:MAG: universal stress protein [Gemmataceae bacterium]
MFRSILVPLDGSPFAEHALPYARAIARSSGAELLLVTVSTPLAEAYVEGLYFSSMELEQELTARHRAYLEDVTRRLGTSGDVKVRTDVRHGEVAATLSGIVENGEADLAVMATHGRGAIGRFWFGSVADEMIGQTHVPLLFVRPTSEKPNLEIEPDLTRIVIPLDGSGEAEHILDHVTQLARVIPKAEVILVRAIRAIIPVETAPDVPEAEREARTLLKQVQTLQHKLRSEAQQYLDEISVHMRTRGLTVQTQVVVEDDPAVAILQEAESCKAGFIALETHGRHGISRLIQGSIADKVLRGSHIPVMVHRSK